MAPDSGTEVFTVIDTTGFMPIPPIQGDLADMLTLIILEAVVPAKASIVQTVQGLINTIRHRAIVTHRLPTVTTWAEELHRPPMGPILS